MDEVGQNMSYFIRGWCISTVCGSLRQFNVVFSPQSISVGLCKIHACKVAYHAPFHPWIYLFIENRFFNVFLIPLLYVLTLLQHPEL